MDQLFFVEEGHVEWREIPSPELIDATDALLRPVAVATCDLDTGLVHGRIPFAGPFPMGHEGVGEVVAIGSDVRTISVGQLAAIPFQISCGSCDRCRRGLTASCRRVNAGAMYGLEPFGGPWGGFLSDTVRVPWADHMLVPLPEGVDPVAVASLSDNVCDGWRTVAPHLAAPADSSVLVVAGWAPSIPFFAVATARALGVPHVDYLDLDGPDAPGADKAGRLGANVLGSPADVEVQSYTATVCSTNDVNALKLALRAVEPDGTCVCNGIFFDDEVPMPMFAMYTRGVHLVTGRVNARAVMPQALQLIVDRALPAGTVTDRVVEWDDAVDALLDAPRKLVFRR